MQLIRIGAAVVVIGALLGGCTISGSTTEQIDEEKGEELIDQALEEELGVEVSSVKCPEREIKKGDVFTCTATIDGEPLEIEVTQTNDEGTVEWERTQAVLDIAGAEEEIAVRLSEEFSREFTVDCGKARILIKSPGETFSCQATDSEGEGGEVRGTVKDVDGIVDYETV